MFLGYNTNGLAHHELFDAVELLAEIGYRGVALTIDHGVLPPRNRDVRRTVDRLRRRLEQLDMRSVLETGARYLLDPRRKHEPTLLSDDRRRRIAFYRHAIDCAAQLNAACVSIWSGALNAPISRNEAMDRLADGLVETLDYAVGQGVVVGLEPEPGMLIDSTAAFDELLRRIDRPDLGLTLDIGHLQCQGEPIATVIAHWGSRLVNVHLDDMRRGVHEHLMFGDGEISFPPVFQALRDVGYGGGASVELSRHSHVGPEAASRAFAFLQPLVAR
ncbi:MAG: sugar phosphate isomerase/epimerase [Planctomycetaceae bacterium]|nr:sugar phosphate isomerase/epimerase [Planctomycetaceae bacterium]